ncbi:LysM peptidoglycan-binding domain-containing protein [Marvinbryantia formatexigens]|nr:LysM peptidoglycan-binding domain-containing protein [Marvinbryantia formatexigens]UWO26357.1 LysM peptidoglycan-binding domain-containing protein [Marvinbryantia formatexigens DSM 14469]SDH24915.1 LysM domain-containing protein [Marvinbryantia formatexigens]
MPEISKEWKMPKNIRQIGDGGGERKVYVEDYVITFLEKISAEDAQKKAVLLGEVHEPEQYPCIFVSGAIEADSLSMDEGERGALQEKIQRCFAGKSVVGWFMTAEESPVCKVPEMKEIFQKEFPGEDQVLIVRDAQEEETSVFRMEGDEPVMQPGFYIYYDKNPAMQEYMIAQSGGKSVEKEEPVKDDAIKRFRKIIKEKKKMPQIAIPAKGRLVYLTGGLLVVTVLALGVTMVYNYDKMKEVEQNLARLTSNVDSQSSYLEEDAEAAQVMLHMEDDAALQNGISAGRQTEETEETELLTETVTPQTAGSSAEAEDSPAAQIMQDNNAVQEEGITQTEAQTESTEDADTTVQTTAVARASYTVKAGDTLAGISEMYYGSLDKVAEICTLNGIDDENTILPGQKILLP